MYNKVYGKEKKLHKSMNWEMDEGTRLGNLNEENIFLVEKYEDVHFVDISSSRVVVDMDTSSGEIKRAYKSKNLNSNNEKVSLLNNGIQGSKLIPIIIHFTTLISS